ncbi:MAG TPA: zinc-binding dehydrogenase [Phaeodactylibacter sp.]|nr:zinc-binding dehydrogenase [Phaeodactylibacter sp.]
MTKRKAWYVNPGSLSNLKLVEEHLPMPSGRQVLVQVRAIGLNFADVFSVKGLYQAAPKEAFVPGLEFAGEVIATGPEVRRFKEGDAVMGVTRFGAYVSHILHSEDYLNPLPEGWSFEEGAAYPVQALTAYYALVKLGDLQEGMTVLIHSAAGGVGTFANRIAKKYGAYTIGTVSRPEKVAYCREEGYDKVIVRSKNFGEQLDEALGERPLQLVMECIGGRVLAEAWQRLASQGRMIVYGAARYTNTGDKPNYLRLMWQYFTRPKIDPQAMTHRNVGILGFNLIYLYGQIETMRQQLSELERLNLGKPRVGHRLPFEELPEALRLFQSGKTTGKVVLQLT